MKKRLNTRKAIYSATSISPTTLVSNNHQSLWIRAQERLEYLYRTAGVPDALTTPAVLLIGSMTDDNYHELRANYLTFARNQQSTVLVLSCRQPGLISFWPLRSLLEQLAPILMKEAPVLIHSYAAELSVIHSDFMQQLAIQSVLPLSQIALTPSERRSHRESEQAFRIINGFCALLIEAQQACPTLAEAPLVIWWEDLQLADRPTLLTYRRLNRWISQSGASLMLIGNLCLTDALLNEDGNLPDSVSGHFDWRVWHRQLVDKVRSQLLGEEIVISDVYCSTVPFSIAPHAEAVPKGQTDESRATLLALHYFDHGNVEDGCAYALQAMRLAIFVLNLEAVLFLGRQIMVALNLLPDGKFDTERFAEIWQHLRTDDPYIALEFSVSAIQQPNDILIATWKAVALIHSFLGDHHQAMICYQHALQLADSPAMRAQLYMYLGLIAGKRLFNVEQAQEYLNQGFQAIDGLTDAAASLERGWLLNVSALMAFQTKQYAKAMKLIQDALAGVKQFHHSEATHLKINLISNISVLLEAGGKIDQALKTWMIFNNFLEAANEIFSKHYLFREGGLHAKAGKYTEAISCYCHSYAQAEAIHDKFHMRIISNACGYLNYRQEKLDEAQQWFAKSSRLCEETGDYENLPLSLLAQAICHYQMGQHPAARELLQQVESIYSRPGIAVCDSVRTLKFNLDAATPKTLAEWEELAIKPTSTKLNRPFHLINLYT